MLPVHCIQYYSMYTFLILKIFRITVYVCSALSIGAYPIIILKWLCHWSPLCYIGRCRTMPLWRTTSKLTISPSLTLSSGSESTRQGCSYTLYICLSVCLSCVTVHLALCLQEYSTRQLQTLVLSGVGTRINKKSRQRLMSIIEESR